MTELQYAEEALKDSREFLHNVVVIKWALVCMAVSLWGLTAYFLLKEIPKWWHSYDKKRSLDKMKKDLAAAERPRNLDKLPKGTYEGGHY